MKAKWTILVEAIMAKRHTYSNLFMELHVPDTIGFVLSNVDPSKGYFGDTSALSKGIQLKEHHVKIRGQYNSLIVKLDKGGFHAAHDELLRAAYDRTTEGNKVKDIGLLFYYLLLRNWSPQNNPSSNQNAKRTLNCDSLGRKNMIESYHFQVLRWILSIAISIRGIL